ncbi:hypothetical protein SNK04_14523 [Fusarium graminearum]
MHGTGGGAAFETTDAEWQCLDPRSNHLRDEGVVKKVKKLHTELRSDLEDHPRLWSRREGAVVVVL